MKRSHIWQAGTVALGLGIVLTGPAAVFASDTSATVTANVTAGTRTASITNLTLQPMPVAHTNTTTTGDFLTLAIDDSNGAGAGWNVTIETSDLAYSGANDGNVIAGVNLAIDTPGAPTYVAGQAIDPTDGPFFVGVGGTLDSPIKVIGAAASVDHGAGTYAQSIPIHLTVPADSMVGAYTATLTVSITDGP